MSTAVTDVGAEVSARLLGGDRADLIGVFSIALSSAAKAYAPYSRFHVGAAFTSDAGRVFSGCNVENASYPIGTCAERDALAAYVLGREQGEKLTALALVAVHITPDGAVHAPCSPCGACRQAIMELCPDAEVQFFWGDPLRLATNRAPELLPSAFALGDDR